VKRPEQIIQTTLVQHLRLRAPKDCFWFHVPNQGKRTPYMGKIMKDLGVRAGVPDLMFIHDGKAFGLELKADKGVPTESQQAALDAISAAGGHACAARGLDRAIAVLESWGLLK
jgi:hypothetical protein